MKKILLPLILSLCSMTFAYAFDFAVANEDGVMIYYNRNETNATVATRYDPYWNSPVSYMGSVAIPNKVVYNGTTFTVTAIKEGAFYNCKDLTTLILPNSLTSIGEAAFYNCSGLASVSIPNSLTSIGGVAFSGCSGLTDVVLEDGITPLIQGSGAFDGCPLTSLYLGRDISGSPFSGNTTLTTLTIGNDVTSIGNSAFSNCSGLTGTLTLPNSVTSIGESAFSGCSGFTDVVLEDGTTTLSVDGSAFFDCPLTSLYLGRDISGSPFSGNITLATLTIGNDVTSIDESAFKDCSYLTTLTIGNSVTSIGNGAFKDCSELVEINSKNPIPPQAKSDTFAGVGKRACTLYVPISCATFYGKKAIWEDFFDIQEKDFLQQLQTIVFPEIANKTYGDTSFDLTGTSDSGLPLAYTSSNNDVATIIGNTVTLHNTGIVQITASQSGNATYYAATSIARILTVSKAPLTIIAEDKQRKQGEENPELTLSYDGFVNDDNSNVLNALPTILCLADKTSPVGFYDITLSGGADNNYNYTLVYGKLEVTENIGVESASTTQVAVYPNPATDYLYIQSESPIERVELYNQVGACVLAVDSFTERIEISGLPDGIYLARIYVDGTPLTRKVRIKK